MRRRADIARTPGAFTLVELIVVMALLAMVAAFAAPSLSRSLRDRHLEQEAVRFLAMTEYARNEAVSQGVPMLVWVEGESFGVEPKPGFPAVAGRARQHVLGTDIHFDLANSATAGKSADVMEFAPDGTAATWSIESVRIVDRFDTAVLIARTNDGWGYEIAREDR